MNTPVNHQPLIGTGEVRHTRQRPRLHALAYRTWFLLLPSATMRRPGGGPLAGYGFHEGGFKAGRAAAQGILQERMAEEPA